MHGDNRQGAAWCARVVNEKFCYIDHQGHGGQGCCPVRVRDQRSCVQRRTAKTWNARIAGNVGNSGRNGNWLAFAWVGERAHNVSICDVRCRKSKRDDHLSVRCLQRIAFFGTNWQYNFYVDGARQLRLAYGAIAVGVFDNDHARRGRWSGVQNHLHGSRCALVAIGVGCTNDQIVEPFAQISGVGVDAPIASRVHHCSTQHGDAVLCIERNGIARCRRADDGGAVVACHAVGCV